MPESCKILPLLVLVLLLPCLARAAAGSETPGSPAESSDRPFDGFYGGIGIGSQNIIAGSLVGGRDILANDHRSVVELFLGWRKRFGSDWVVGAEVQLGRFDAELEQVDPRTGASVRYDSDSQIAYGFVFGKRIESRRPILVFVYALETERSFDVDIAFPALSFEQEDEQGLLRYGLGLEIHGKRVGWRATLGSHRADFGGVPTNIDPDGELDLGIGLLYSF